MSWQLIFTSIPSGFTLAALLIAPISLRDVLQWELGLQVPVLSWSAPKYRSEVRREGGNRQRTAMEIPV
jgi:hypothetical protein